MPTKKYPFKFLDAYNRDDRDLFFGRDEEIEALYLMVFQTDLILLCGASGTGKTSLIQCGLANKFQPYEWLAINIRRGDNINQSLEKALADAGAGEAVPVAASDSLDWLDDVVPQTAPLSGVAQRLKNLYLRHFKPVFLIFDQFEELFILGSKSEQDRFIEQVREMLRIEQPVKIILSIREEYLGFLYDFERKVPELLHKKIRIEPMHLGKVTEVVQGMCHPGNSLVTIRPGEEARFGQLVFEKLKAHDNVRTIELPYLQVLLDKLYLQITGDETRHAPAVFSIAELEKMGDIGNLLANFLDDQVQKNARTLDTSPETIKKLLSPFVTLDGTKEPLSAAMLHSRVADLGLTEDFIARCLQAFQNSQILRFDEKEQRYEVKHDSLARQIATYQDAEDVALQKAGQIIRTQLLMEVDRRDLFTEKQLLFIEPFLEKLQPAADQMAWIEKSRIAIEAHKDEELRRQEAENERIRQDALREKHRAEEAERLQVTAEQGRQRARTFAWLAGLVAVVAIGIGVYAWFKQQEATQKTLEAKENLDKMKAAERLRLQSEVAKYLNAAEKMHKAGDPEMAEKILLSAPLLDAIHRDPRVDSLLRTHQ